MNRKNYPAIKAENLNKIYKGSGKDPDKHALKDFSLTIPQGCIFGLLGPNGAGKSTFINILAGLVMKTSGSASICGYDIEGNPRHAKANIGVVPQELNLDAFFKPKELLDIQAGLYGVRKKDRRTDEILEAMALSDKANTYARKLSGGMQRRLLVAKALVHNPPVLILDEPTAGVDVELRQHLWRYVRKLNEQGTTIILTTHYLEEAEELCDHIAIINHGELVTCQPKHDLINSFQQKQIIVTFDTKIDAVLPTSLEKYTIERISGTTLKIKQDQDISIHSIIEDLTKTGLVIKEIETEQADLEDVFVHLTSSSTS